MKSFSLLGALPLLVIMMAFLCILPTTASSRHISRRRSHQVVAANNPLTGTMSLSKVDDAEMTNFYWVRRPTGKKGIPHDTLKVAGSSLPDCSHACGSCTPCRLVMVSFVCATLEEAETCPMAYKCMCKNKSYPVP